MRRRHLTVTIRCNYEESICSDAEDTRISLPIAENGWPVLNWLIMLFERDERQMEEKGQGTCVICIYTIPHSSHSALSLARYSPLLLLQIPPAKLGSHTRWDADLPLDIVWFCLTQHHELRKNMGVRLMTLVCTVVVQREHDTDSIFS